MKQMVKFLGLILVLTIISCNSGNGKLNSPVVYKESGDLQDSIKSNLKIDSFLITENSVGIFKRGMTINEVIEIIPEKQIKKKIGFGEFQDDTYDDYEIYDSKNTHLLTITPKIQYDLNSTINRVKIVDSRFKTESGIGIESTYDELLHEFEISDYSPDIEHIVLNVQQLNVWLSIKKTELNQEWWNEKTKKIDISKIPGDAQFDSFITWWK